MGHVFKGPEGLLIWCSDWNEEMKREARMQFPWWNKVKPAGREDLDDFAPEWHPKPEPRFLFKEQNTGRIMGAVE
ncbi:hypothetical protein ACFL2Q_09510 [Thermodesulfobacteriota bacterium]